jgi:hypothetical protein
LARRISLKGGSMVVLHIAAICGGALSLFRLGHLLWEFELSAVLTGVVRLYEDLLLPIRVVLAPAIEWVASRLHLALPAWWLHAFVVWMVVGGIAGRAWASEEGIGSPGAEERVQGVLFGVLLGPFALALTVGRAVVMAMDDDMDLAKYLVVETVYVLGATFVYVATNFVT